MFNPHRLLTLAFCLLGVLTPRAAVPPIASQKVVTGLSKPLFVTAPPGDTNRIFIVEQGGKIKVAPLATYKVETTPFLTISGLLSGNEQGLLGLAFHPGYATNGYFFVNYTITGGGAAGHTEIARFQAKGDPKTSNLADLATRKIFLSYNQPEANHNGGWIGFGPDGYLYIAAGDGGGGDDRHGTIGNGQDRNSLLGKLLRIDVDTGDVAGIPDGNPFKGDTAKKQEIWAYGLRNPWRCSFDRLTGELWIGDVGQNTREEIDVIPAGVGGLNYGWRPREGAIQNPNYDGSPYPLENPVAPVTEPVYDYPRGLGVSVTGGYVYRGAAIPGLRGYYIFADYGSARLWGFTRNAAAVENFQELTSVLDPGSPKPIQNISSFGEDAGGEMYICDLNDGEIFKIIPPPSAQPQIANHRVANGQFQFSFDAAAGKAYVVEYRAELLAGSWQTLRSVASSTVSTFVSVADPLGNSQRFYRVRVQ